MAASSVKFYVEMSLSDIRMVCVRRTVMDAPYLGVQLKCSDISFFIFHQRHCVLPP